MRRWCAASSCCLKVAERADRAAKAFPQIASLKWQYHFWLIGFAPFAWLTRNLNSSNMHQQHAHKKRTFKLSLNLFHLSLGSLDHRRGFVKCLTFSKHISHAHKNARCGLKIKVAFSSHQRIKFFDVCVSSLFFYFHLLLPWHKTF